MWFGAAGPIQLVLEALLGLLEELLSRLWLSTLQAVQKRRRRRGLRIRGKQFGPHLWRSLPNRHHGHRTARLVALDRPQTVVGGDD